MDRKPGQTFFQKGNADGQQAHEKVLNINNTVENSMAVSQKNT